MLFGAFNAGVVRSQTCLLVQILPNVGTVWNKKTALLQLVFFNLIQVTWRWI